MNVLVIDGSRRAKSNTGAIARDIQGRLTAAGAACDVWRVPRWSAAPDETDEALRRIACTETIVLVAPSYLDELPAVTQRLLEALHERRAELDGHAPLFYGIAHSGFPEPVQRRAELASMRFFAERMGWRWMGGVGFGGTSPIGGRPLDEAGMFSKQLRACLPSVCDDVFAARVLSDDTVRRCDKSPFPLPLRVMVALVNSRTRKAVRAGKLDLEGRVYAG